jgi:hypothetical protein
VQDFVKQYWQVFGVILVFMFVLVHLACLCFSPFAKASDDEPYSSQGHLISSQLFVFL